MEHKHLWTRRCLAVTFVMVATGMIGLAAVLAQNEKRLQPAGVKPVQINPVQVQPVPAVKPGVVPAQPAQPVKPGEAPPGGGGVQPVPPEKRVVPEPLQWEFRVVEFIGRDTEEHTKLLNQLAAEGWQYVGLINLYVTQTNGTTNGQPTGLVAFRRPKIQVRPVPRPIQPLPVEPQPD